jgi:hypothetical protein
VKYKIWNWPTESCLPVLFDTWKEAADVTDFKLQRIVSVPSNDEDEVYMGAGEIWCEHALHPTECVHCNPKYENYEPGGLIDVDGLSEKEAF